MKCIIHGGGVIENVKQMNPTDDGGFTLRLSDGDSKRIGPGTGFDVIDA